MEVSSLHALNVENFTGVFPSALAEDKELSALARASAEQFDALIRNTGLASVLINIDNLPEGVLDILARDFRVDWYDGNASLEQKRLQIKTAFDVHRHKGTKAAVETAVSTIVPGATVEEWFEYGGEPYCFHIRMDTDGSDLDAASRQRILQNVQYYKNARSHLESLHYRLDPDSVPNAPLRVAPVTGDAYVQLTVPAPDTGDLYGYALSVEENGDLYELSDAHAATRFSLNNNGDLYYLYDESETPPTFSVEDGKLYEWEEES